MELKELSAQDAGIITQLFQDVFTHAPWNDDWSDRKQLDAYISELIGQSSSLTLGCFEAGRLVGLSMGHIKHWFEGTEYCIEEFCVDRELQGRGIGSEFMREIEAFLVRQGICRIFLLTERNVPAYGFYLHQGFHELKDNVAFAKRLGR